MTDFIPLQRMQQRIELERCDSTSAYFTTLLYGCELVAKLVTSAFVAAIGDDADRHRYRIEHRLVRASGIGDWVTAMNEAFAGPASAHLDAGARKDRDQITAKTADGVWQFEAARLLRETLIGLSVEVEPHPKRAQLLQWFRDFAVLRNKTRGHGALSQACLDGACEQLGKSLKIVIDNLSVFSRSWAFIRRNLSNKYRVCRIGGTEEPFVHLRANKDVRYEEGIYIAFDILRHCRLVHTDQDLSDFYHANGGFTDQRYEALSYITGEVQYLPSHEYLRPSETLPGSVTEGASRLDIIGTGGAFTNLPEQPPGYIARPQLEQLLSEELLANGRHPIITLDGRGGIGKTSTALHVISDLASQPTCPFSVIIWFSARDIDLIPEGAKTVRPAGITIDDFAAQYASLLEVEGRFDRMFSTRDALATGLAKGAAGPTLFVFDNFETVVTPAEAFSWIDAYVRLPNKVVITTRMRGDFKADLPIRVHGMSDSECESLISATAQRIGIRDRLSADFVNNLISESEGHPYVVKVLLGELARSPSTRKVARVMASRDDILEALFERTFNAISPAARRVFLTLAGWKSVVPELAVEAVLIRPGNERLDVREAIEELVNSSLIDEVVGANDEYFLSVPLAAQVFGRKKFDATPYRGSIAEDIKLLQQFGAAQKNDVGHGLESRLNTLFRNMASLIGSGERSLDECLPIIEYVARKVPKAWLYLADLCEEKLPDPDKYVRDCLGHYLERDGKDDSRGWKRLADSFAKAGMVHEEINALVSLAKTDGAPIFVVSNCVNRVNGLLRASPSAIEQLDRRQLVRELAETLAKRIDGCDATDLSRLAWLYMSLHEHGKASDLVNNGLQKDPENGHCLNLRQRLDS